MGEWTYTKCASDAGLILGRSQATASPRQSRRRATTALSPRIPNSAQRIPDIFPCSRLYVVAVKIAAFRPWPQVTAPHSTAAVPHRSPPWKTSQPTQHGIPIPKQAEEQPGAYPLDQRAYAAARARRQAQPQGATRRLLWGTLGNMADM